MTDIDCFSTQSIRSARGLEWDFYTLLDRITDNLHHYAQEHEAPLDSVGVECCGVDYGLLDAGGKLLGLPHNYRDPRTRNMDCVVSKTMTHEEIYRRTGIHFMRHNTLNQLIAERECDEKLLERAQSLLFLGDLFHYFLTGERHVEYSGVSISQLYNYLTRDWDGEIFDAFSIPSTICEGIINAGDVYGPLKPELLRKLHLNDGVVAITPPTHDSASAVVPIPKVDDGDLAYISSGTWSIIGLEIDRPIVTAESLQFNISNSGTALGKLMFTKNIMGLWIIQQCRRIWEQTKPDLTFAEIVALAERETPFRAMIDPDDAVFFDAPNTPKAIETYLRETGQPVLAAQNIGGIARVIFESLAFKYRYIFSHMFQASGKRVREIHIIGGGGNNEAINQFTANVTGMRVVVSLPKASAVGNAMMQLYGLGAVGSLQEIREVVHRSFPCKVYQPRDTDVWDKRYTEFLALLQARASCSFS